MITFRTDASFIRDNGDGSISRVTAYFRISPQLVTSAQQLDLDTILLDLNEQVQNYNGCGSGFVLDYVNRFVLCIAAYRPLQGSTFMPTPEWLLKKQCVINVQNTTDNLCFIWAILSAIYAPKHNAHRLSHYIAHKQNLNLDGLQFPMSTKLIPCFETNNPEISVNVLYADADSRGFFIEYLSPHRERKHHVNLLLLDHPEDPMKRHYVFIKNMSALVCHRTNHQHKVHVCNSCLHPFTNQDTLNRHIPYCIRHAPQQVEYPDPNNRNDCTLKFRSKQNQHEIPFAIIAYMETFLTPVERAESEESSGLNVIDEHMVSGWC